MSSPWRRTFPSTLALGMVSCIRFRHRMRVDFPQPDGPMIAATMCSSMSIVIPWMANFSPYQADNDSTRSLTAIVASPRDRTEADDDARCDADSEHDEDQEERRPPSRLVFRQLRSGRPHEDGVREGFDGLIESSPPVIAAEGGHEEGGCLTRHAS